MRVKATVISTEGNIAIVESERLSACDGCHKHAEGCSVCSLMGSNKKITSRAKNTLGATVGDMVEIETETKTVLFYAMLVFIFPLVIMLALYALAGVLELSEPFRYVTSLCGFALTYLCIWLYSKFKVSKKYDVKIVNIISKKKIELSAQRADDFAAGEREK